MSKHVGDLTKIFEILREHKLHINASKCSFGVDSGKFLDYMVTHKEIEVNPDQIKAINNLQPPRNPKEVQKLTGMMAALNWLISSSVDRCRPFFLLLHKWKGFEWTDECVVEFQQLKQYLSRPPIMSSPVVDKILFSYLVVAFYAISFVLIWVDSGIQRPVYYVASHLMKLKCVTYRWKRLYWRWCMLQENFSIISKHISWSSSPSCHSSQYSGVQIILEGLLSGAQFLGLLI